MGNFSGYMKSTVIMAVVFFAFFAAALAILGVLEVTSWEDVKEYLVKGSIVTLIATAFFVITGVAVNAAKKDNKK